MNWGEERYVRVYLRDTPAWCALSFHAQSLLVLLHRKVDRDGRLQLGRLGRRGVAVSLHQVALWDSVLAPAVADLEADGHIRVEGEGDGTALVIPDFRAAQEATATGAARVRKHRERKQGNQPAKKVTKRYVDGTKGYPEVTNVTPSQPAVPPVPPVPSQPASQPEQPKVAGCPEESIEEGQDPGLHRFRADLAARLSMPSIGVGKDWAHVLAVFDRYIRDWGRDNALSECASVAAESKNGPPANLSWWVGWIDKVKRPPGAQP